MISMVLILNEQRAVNCHKAVEGRLRWKGEVIG